MYDETNGPADTIDGCANVQRTVHGLHTAGLHQLGAAFYPDNLPFTVRATSDAFFDLYDRQAVATDVFGRTKMLDGRIAYG